jgi:hypothetical protein
VKPDIGNTPGQAAVAQARAEIVQALTGLNYDADLALAQRTRRVVRSAAISLAERRAHQRRIIGFAVIAIVTFAILMAPVIWDAVQDLYGGERLGDLPTEFMLLLMMLLPAVFAALVAVWKSNRDVHHDRSSF